MSTAPDWVWTYFTDSIVYFTHTPTLQYMYKVIIMKFIDRNIHILFYQKYIYIYIFDVNWYIIMNSFAFINLYSHRYLYGYIFKCMYIKSVNFYYVDKYIIYTRIIVYIWEKFISIFMYSYNDTYIQKYYTHENICIQISVLYMHKHIHLYIHIYIHKKIYYIYIKYIKYIDEYYMQK